MSSGTTTALAGCMSEWAFGTIGRPLSVSSRHAEDTGARRGIHQGANHFHRADSHRQAGVCRSCQTLGPLHRIETWDIAPYRSTAAAAIAVPSNSRLRVTFQN